MTSTPLSPDEQIVVEKFRAAKGMRHAGIEISVKDGMLVRLDVTEKVDLSHTGGYARLREGQK